MKNYIGKIVGGDYSDHSIRIIVDESFFKLGKCKLGSIVSIDADIGEGYNMKEYDDFIIDGANKGYQLYWCAYCFVFNLDIEHKPESNVSFMLWIQNRHREFEPNENIKNANRVQYTIDFKQWLKTYVINSRNN